MPTVTFKGNPVEALALSEMTARMKGPGNLFPHRQAVRERILGVWPELKNGIKEGDAVLSSERAFELSPEEQTALSEGMLSLCRNEDMMDAERQRVLAIARLCHFEGWLRRQLTKGEVAAFMGSDEDVSADLDEENQG